jgi:L-alanine-DL-glutamate epimerase-like enolase superfamily enzyme
MLSYHCTGWLGYSNDQVKTLCSKYLAKGFTAFKVKVGQNLEDDRCRCAMVRDIIGWDNKLVSTITIGMSVLYFLYEYKCVW